MNEIMNLLVHYFLQIYKQNFGKLNEQRNLIASEIKLFYCVSFK